MALQHVFLVICVMFSCSSITLHLGLYHANKCQLC